MWFEMQSTVKKKVIIDFAMRTTFGNFYKSLPIEKLLAWLQRWLEVSSKPQNHICDMLYLFCMHSVKFLKGPLFDIFDE